MHSFSLETKNKNTRHECFENSKINLNLRLGLAPLTGLEPVTVGLEVQCSVQLSYRGGKLAFKL